MCRVPVATSSLMQVPWVQAMLPPGKRVGVITVSATSLTPRHLEAAGVPADTPFVGTEDGAEFFRVLIRGEKAGPGCELGGTGYPAGRANADGAASGYRGDRAGVHQHAALCRMLREALGVPVYDIYSLITWFHAGLRPRVFGGPGREMAVNA